MSLQIIQNQIGYVNPAAAALDTGWTISGEYAIHTSCNAGYVKSRTSLNMEVGETYIIKYLVEGYTSGLVRVECGSSVGVNRMANGEFTDTLVCEDEAILKFYSNGGLKIKELNIAREGFSQVAGTTISFNTASKKWGCQYSFLPELMARFGNEFFTFKNGELWLQNSNPVCNNFYDVQYVSKVKLYANLNPTTKKLYYNMRVKSNKVWFCPTIDDIIIYPYEGKPNGMKSRLKRNKFVPLYGDWFAEFLRNAIDPRFVVTADALLGGDELRGEVMEITLTNDDTVDVTLFEIDIQTAPMNYTR